MSDNLENKSNNKKEIQNKPFSFQRVGQATYPESQKRPYSYGVSMPWMRRIETDSN